MSATPPFTSSSTLLLPSHTTLYSAAGAMRFTLLGSRWVTVDRADAACDEDSRQLREAVGTLATHIEQVVRSRRDGTDAAAIGQQAQVLAHCVRAHQLFLTGLGSAWHALYEFGVYQSALQALRQALGAWQHQLDSRNSPSERSCFERFELLAWRALGESLLLSDMYGQQSGKALAADRLATTQSPGAAGAFTADLRAAPATAACTGLFMAGGVRPRRTALQRAHAWWTRWRR